MNRMKMAAMIFAFILMISQTTIEASAHEIFEDGKGNGVRLVMDVTNSEGLPFLIVFENVAISSNPDLKIYKDNYKAAISSWTDRYIGGKHITASYPEISNAANIRIYSYSNAYSNYGIPLSALGATVLYDTNHNRIENYSTAVASTGRISKAVIILNYDISIFGTRISNETLVSRVQKTIAHEVGHAMGLGHPTRSTYNPIASNTYSVMRQGFPGGYVDCIPAAHDVSDMRKKYINKTTL